MVWLSNTIKQNVQSLIQTSKKRILLQSSLITHEVTQFNVAVYNVNYSVSMTPLMHIIYNYASIIPISGYPIPP